MQFSIDWKVYSIVIKVLLNQTNTLQVFLNEWTANTKQIKHASYSHAKQIHYNPKAHLAEQNIAYFHETTNRVFM